VREYTFTDPLVTHHLVRGASPSEAIDAAQTAMDLAGVPREGRIIAASYSTLRALGFSLSYDKLDPMSNAAVKRALKLIPYTVLVKYANYGLSGQYWL